MSKKKISESDLCKLFADKARLIGWTIYPEQYDWDILMIKNNTQVGVQAKLTLNVKVLEQTIPSFNSYTGPDFRAILVPENTSPKICQSLGIVVFTPEGKIDELLTDELNWFPESRYQEPKYESGSIAGSPSPVRLTDWKIKALKIIARCEVRGFVTTKDFKQLSISPTMWLYSNKKWLKPLGEGKYGLCKVNLHLTHPVAYHTILEETKKLFKPES
jgi:hypothetical protein